MGLGLSLLTVCDVLRAAIPTFADGVVGRADGDRVDRRLELFAKRVVERAGIHLEVVGGDQVPADRAFVYMSNHLSHVDIPVLFAALPAKRLRMIAKAELFKIPVVGGALRSAGFVSVDRKNRAKAIGSLRQAQLALTEGTSIWIAPEGTRSTSGALGSLKKGGFHVASATKTPIVPVALSGTDKVLPAHGRAMNTGVHVRVAIGAPIPVKDRPIGETMDEVRTFFLANT